MEKNRNYYIDILKGVSIIFVVLGHCIQFGSGSMVLKEGLYFGDTLYRFIYSFHMPLFMAISGYLFGFTLRKYSGKVAIKRRAKSLLIPIICWTTIITLIDLVVTLTNNVDISWYLMIKRYIKNILFELWFLWAVLWGSILTLALKKINERSKVLFGGIVVILFVGNFVSIDSWNLHLYKYTIPFFIAGYLWNMLNGYERIMAMLCSNQKHTHLIVGVFLLTISFVLMLRHYDNSSFIYISKVSIIGKSFNDSVKQICIDLYRWAIGVLGCAFIAIVVRIIYKCHCELEWCAYIGQKSMGIYIIIGYLNSRVLAKLTQAFQLNYGVALIETVVMIMLNLLMIKIISMNKASSEFLLGNR